MTKRVALALGTGLVLAAVLTYPTIVHPGSMARLGTGDGQFSVWNVAWVAHALVDDPRHVFDANIFYPATGTLAYSEANLVAGALAAPVYAATRNPLAAHNVVVYVVLVGAFMAMWALVGRLTGNWTAALVSATGFAFCGNVSSRTAEIQLLMVFVFPVVLLAFHRFADVPGVGRAVALGLAIALGGLSSAYYGIFAGLAVGLAALWFAPSRSHWRRYWLGLGLAALVAGAVVAPVFRPYLALRNQPGARGTLNLEEAQAFSADPGAYLRTAGLGGRWMLKIVGSDGELLFPGFVVIGLAVAGLAAVRVRAATQTGRRQRRIVAFYAALTVLSVWASLGPSAGLYAWIAKLVPPMGFLRAPARLGIVVTFGLAVIAGFGLAAILARARRAWIVPALVVLCAAEVAAVPWPLRTVPPPSEAYQYLATAPRGAVVEFHFPYRRDDLPRNTRFMFWSMWHWQPLVNGYSDFVPKDYWDIAVPINSFPSEEAFAILRSHHVRYVVVHLESYNDPDKAAAFFARFPAFADRLIQRVKTDDTWLFEVR